MFDLPTQSPGVPKFKSQKCPAGQALEIVQPATQFPLATQQYRPTEQLPGVHPVIE